jgi:tRNA(Ile)-lysidine synthase
MKVSVAPGKYIVAVSGGVDSMVLMNLLAQLPDIHMVIAHFDHAIRPDSAADCRFVAQAAQRLDLSFVSARGDLGPDASEASARTARYAFLERARQEQGAAAIITAHHQDDLLETAIINMLRGTGRKGLTALADNPRIIRPLLHVPKTDVVQYAQHYQLQWHEDSTNADDRYLRNYVRHAITSIATPDQRAALLKHITDQQLLNTEIDARLAAVIREHTPGQRQLDRSWFIGLPHIVSTEAMATWLRLHDIRAFDRRMVERLVVAAKTAQVGKIVDIRSGYRLQIGRNTLQLL